MDEPLLFFTLLLPLLGLGVGVMEWTLAPLIAAARSRAPQRRFMLTDLLWLVVQLQMVMALVAWAYPPNSPGHSRVWGLIALCLPVTVFWIASLQAVSQAGILRPLQRAAVFVIVLPGAIAVIIGAPLLTGTLVVMVLSSVMAESSREADLGFVATEAFLCLSAMWILRLIASWTVAERST